MEHAGDIFVVENVSFLNLHKTTSKHKLSKFGIHKDAHLLIKVTVFKGSSLARHLDYFNQLKSSIGFLSKFDLTGEEDILAVNEDLSFLVEKEKTYFIWSLLFR